MVMQEQSLGGCDAHTVLDLAGEALQLLCVRPLRGATGALGRQPRVEVLGKILGKVLGMQVQVGGCGTVHHVVSI
jgi:hypothetical protein